MRPLKSTGMSAATTKSLMRAALLSVLLLMMSGHLNAQCHAHFQYSVVNGTTTVIFANLSNDSTGNFQSFWDFGDGSTSMAKNPIHTYAQGGVYQVCLAIYNPATSCYDIECKPVFITGPPSCQSFFKVRQDSSGGPGSFLFLDQSFSQSTIVTWSWNFGDGATSNQKNPSHSYLAPGPYNVCLTITTNTSCQSSHCMVIEVGAPNRYHLGGQVFAGNVPVDEFDLVLYRNTGFAVQSLDTVRFDTLGYYYFFQLPAGPYFMKAMPSAGSQFAGSFVPTYQGNEVLWTHCTPYSHQSVNFAADMSLVPITKPATAGPGRIAGRILAEPGGPLPPGPAAHIGVILFDASWNITGYTSSNAQGYYQFTQLPSGDYNVYPEVTGVQTYPAAVTLTSTMSQLDSVNFRFGAQITSLGEGIAFATSPIVYPNPCMDVCTIEWPTGKKVTVELANTAGQVVFSKTDVIAGPHIQIETGSLPAGIYFISLRDGDGAMHKLKLLKQ